jgi:hypothetical protein
MKPLSFALATILGLLVNTRADAEITLGLSSVEDARILFAGGGHVGGFQFLNGLNGNGFAITTGDGSPVGSPPELFGTISGAFPYQLDDITTLGPLQTVALRHLFTGVLTIGPAVGPALTANIVGIDLFSLGAMGGYNGLLSNIEYSGSNDALEQFRDEATAGGGIMTISYQFGSPKSLTELAVVDGSITSTTYSGTITTGPVAVPEPGTLGMAFSGVALLGLGFYRQRRRKLS